MADFSIFGPDDLNDLEKDASDSSWTSYWNLARNAYDDAVNAIIMPPRQHYTQQDLGPTRFTFPLWPGVEREGMEMVREDLVLQNPLGDQLQCSWWHPTRSLEEETSESKDNAISSNPKNTSPCQLAKELASRLMESITVKDQKHQSKTYRQCFAGNEAVSWMIENNEAIDVEDAVQKGKLLINFGFVSHLTANLQIFANKSLLYSFNRSKILESAPSSNMENISCCREPAVLYLHCNDRSRKAALEILTAVLQAGMSLFALDLSGCGQSTGQYIGLGTWEHQDVGTAVKYLRKQKVSNIGLWGHSTGAVAALYYACGDPTAQTRPLKKGVTAPAISKPTSRRRTLSQQIQGKIMNTKLGRRWRSGSTSFFGSGSRRSSSSLDKGCSRRRSVSASASLDHDSSSGDKGCSRMRSISFSASLDHDPSSFYTANDEELDSVHDLDAWPEAAGEIQLEDLSDVFDSPSYQQSQDGSEFEDWDLLDDESYHSSIFGMVLDSPLTNISSIVFDLINSGKEEGIRVPAAMVKAGVKAIKTMVWYKAGLDLNHLSPQNIVGKCTQPALFAAAVDDRYVLPKHTVQLTSEYGGHREQYIFEGDHYSHRPSHFLCAGVNFLKRMYRQFTGNGNLIDSCNDDFIEDVDILIKLPWEIS